ncbi:hypothetical protein like AT5G05800 [Hibiscus trionum]|uniref:Myb/SANT-like domain-containing protein n=1 Tax=Hibiscus trionum TaxID=183268 RepID=A0A9W7LLG1_HIBTR|nr:hypothetical protein like AT5G05800 [Hibiscus trionum]
MAPNKKMCNEQVGGDGKEVGRANWSKENLYLFCDLCIQYAEKSKGKRGATISQRMPWKVLEIEFQKKTSLAYDKNKLKNKWDWLRNRWSLWKALKGKETGLGWDHEKGTISASDEWWSKKIEENVHFKAFLDEGVEPELEHKMEQLFGISVAQGILKFTPVMDCSQHVNAGHNSYHCLDEMTSENISFSCGETNKNWQEIWNDNTPLSSPTHSLQSTEHETFGERGSKRANESEVLGSQKSAKIDSTRRVGGAALLAEKLDIMVEAITQRNNKDIELMKLEARGDSSYELADSLAKLVSMPNLIPGSPEFCFACTLIEDPQKRTILHGIPDDTSRLQWIKYLFDKQ